MVERDSLSSKTQCTLWIKKKLHDAVTVHLFTEKKLTILISIREVLRKFENFQTCSKDKLFTIQ